MIQSQKVVSGPAGTSCLTCKRRHKKCDQRRPTCARCDKGGYNCLGYGHNRLSVARSAAPGDLSLHQPPTRNDTNPNFQPTSERLLLERETLGNGSGSLCAAYSTMSTTSATNDIRRDTILSTASSFGYSFVSPAPGTDERHADTSQHPNDIKIGPDRETLAGRCSSPQSLPAVRYPTKCSPSPIQSLRHMLELYTRVPYTPFHLSKTLLDSSNLEDYVIVNCERMIASTYFKSENQLSSLRQSVVSQLRASDFTRWVKFVCARICESFINSDMSQNEKYNLWASQIEQALEVAVTKNTAAGQIQDRLGNWLEILLLKTMIVHGSNIYQVLRSAAATFLQIVYSDPTIWPDHYDCTSVPLVNVLAARRSELGYFALMDITAAMAFGLPQQVEYNTSLGLLGGPVPHEFIHSSPVEFQIALAEINACRDNNLNARSWEEIEQNLVNWQGCPSECDVNWESWMVVAWFAVQESWRHALLVYLYMAVCNASSDDLRVQSSVQQILRVAGTVRKRESSGANVPFFLQYLIVGICARNEKHRSIAREHLANVSDTKFWLMRAADFVPVLDDLWHGAAAGGRPIKWGDYLSSREKMLPVSL